MKRILASLLAVATLAVIAADAQVNPQNLPPSTVYGRLPPLSGPGQAIPFSVLAAQLPGSTSIPASPACTRMWPSANLSGAWNVIDAYGAPVSTIGTTSQGLQEAINFSTSNGQCLRVYGQAGLSVGTQSATLNSSTTITGLSTASLLVGDWVTAAAGGIPLFSKITSIDSASQIHISNAATVTATRTLAFSRVAPGHPSQIGTTATISIPPVELWSAEIYNVNLTCGTNVNGPCLQFDSAIIMDFTWQGGVIVYQPGTPTASSNVVLFKPTNPVPQDGVIGIAASRIYISNNASPANGVANAVWQLDCSAGTISNNHFGTEELNGTGFGSSANTNYGIELLPGAASNCEQNIFDIAYIHLVLTTGVQIGVNSTNAANLRHNIWHVGAIRTAGASAGGLNSYGSYDQFDIGGITNEEGTLNQGVFLQASSNGNKVNYGQISGAGGTVITDSGTCNSWTGANGSQFALYGTTSGCVILSESATATALVTNKPIAGGTGAASTLTLESTSGTGTTDSIIFQTAAQVFAGKITTGQQWLMGPNFAPNSGVVLTVSKNVAAIPSPAATIAMQIAGLDALTATLGVSAFGTGAQPQVSGFFSRGTAASQTATQSGDILMNVGGFGWGGGSYASGGAALVFAASQAYTASNRGTQFDFYTTPNNSDAAAAAAHILNSGSLTVGTTTDPGVGSILASKGIGTVPTTVASLPTCNAGYEGQRAYVTDQNTAVAYRGAVTGSGATRQAVLCSNSAWIQD